jgi:hypothetical protein
MVSEVRNKLKTLLSSQELANKEHIVLILDCWSVNLCEVCFFVLSLSRLLCS